MVLLILNRPNVIKRLGSYLVFLVVFVFSPLQLFGQGSSFNGGGLEIKYPRTEEEYRDLLVEKEINQTLMVRRKMLKAHEILGWSTVALLSINLFITTPGQYDDDVHTIMGITGGSFYFATGLIALFTPSLHDGLVFGGEKESPSKFIHKLLAFIHIPAMIATIVLGLLINRVDAGKLDLGPDSRRKMRKAHTATSILTVTSLTISLVVVYID